MEAITCMPESARIVLYHCLKQTRCVPGDVAELGVWKGGSAALLAEHSDGRTVHLFDTFAGMPKTSQWDQLKEGDFADTSLESVKLLLSGFPNVRFHPGVFPQTTEGLDALRFSFVHLDGDIYNSTKSGLDWFYPRLNTGGIILMDDVGRDDCQGVRKALLEFYERDKTILWARVGDGQFSITKV